MKLSAKRHTKRFLLVATILVILTVACGAFIAPAMAAYACPKCYGLQRVTGGLFVDPAISVEERVELEEVISRHVCAARQPKRRDGLVPAFPPNISDVGVPGTWPVVLRCARHGTQDN